MHIYLDMHSVCRYRVVYALIHALTESVAASAAAAVAAWAASGFLFIVARRALCNFSCAFSFS